MEKYTLEVPENAIIQISYIGYLSQDINVNGKKEITVRLAEDTQSLDEVVVVGYGTQKKGEVASAISKHRLPTQPNLLKDKYRV